MSAFYARINDSVTSLWLEAAILLVVMGSVVALGKYIFL